MRSFAYPLKFILGLGMTLLVLAALLTTALLLLDLNLFRDQLESRVAEAFGRRVTFQGAIHLKPSLRPTLVAEKFRIGNPDWASRRDLAQVSRLEVQVALLPLLRGTLEVLNITLREADVLLEVGPDDTNNFTFGRREGPPELPGINTLRIRDSLIGYRTAAGKLRSCRVTKAKAKNIPRQSVELEGQIVCKDVPMAFSLSGGTPEQFSSPTQPWPLTITVGSGDTTLVAEGSLPSSGGWEGSTFQVTLGGESVASLDTLFDVNLPVRGAFQLAAEFSKPGGVYSLSDLRGQIGSTDVAGRLNWRRIAGGRLFFDGKLTSQSLQVQDFLAGSEAASRGAKEFLDQPIPLDWMTAMDSELEFNIKHILGAAVPIRNVATTAKLGSKKLTLAPLQTTLAGIPARGEFAIDLQEDAPAIRLSAQSQRLDVGRMLEQLKASAQVQGRAENVTLTVSSRGHTPRTLLQHADLNLKTQGGHITVGQADTEKPWAFKIAAAQIQARQAQPIKINVHGKHQATPLALTVDTTNLETLVSATSSWPLTVTVGSGDTTLVAEGSLPSSGGWEGSTFQVTLGGESVASLDTLFDVNLPVRGTFQLAAEFSKSAGVYSLANLKGQIGSTDVAGRLNWRRIAGGRLFFDGKLTSQSLQVQDFLAGSEADSRDAKEFLDQPIPLDWMTAIDSELEFDIKHILGAAVPIRNVATTAKLGSKKLALAPLQTTLAGIPARGEFAIDLQEDAPAIRLTAQSQRLDVGEMLEQLKASAQVQGRTENVTLTVSSRGHTPRTLLQHADLNLKTQGGHITVGQADTEKPWAFKIAAAQIQARQAQPIKISVDSIYRAKPLSLVVDIVNLERLVMGGTSSWPLKVALQASQLRLNATGKVEDPFQGRNFDLAFEITGKDLRKFDPLIDFVIPLEGDYRVTGHFTDNAPRYTLRDFKLNVGQSDIGGFITLVMEKPRPRVMANLVSQTFHIDDLEFTEGVDRSDKRVIPDYAIPVEALRSVNLSFDFEAKRFRMQKGDLGDIVVKATIEKGVSALSADVTHKSTGTRLSLKRQVDVTTNPPVSSLQLKAYGFDYGHILTRTERVEFAQGQVDVEIELSGSGATFRSFLGGADGRIKVIGGAGRIASRALNLWSSDLARKMLSIAWRRESMTDLNCIVGYIDVENGVAKTDKLLLDTTQLTIAGSGALDLDTEQLDLLLSPSPRQASLVSLAQPVRVSGPLAAPSVAVTKLPRRGNTAAVGLLAGLVNPAFLLFTFSDIGSGSGNPCVAAIEKRDSVPKDERQRRTILQRFRSLF